MSLQDIRELVEDLEEHIHPHTRHEKATPPCFLFVLRATPITFVVLPFTLEEFWLCPLPSAPGQSFAFWRTASIKAGAAAHCGSQPPSLPQRTVPPFGGEQLSGVGGGLVAVKSHKRLAQYFEMQQLTHVGLVFWFVFFFRFVRWKANESAPSSNAGAREETSPEMLLCLMWRTLI